MSRAWWVLFLVAACTVGSVGPGGGGQQPDASGGGPSPDSGSGGGSGSGAGSGSLTVTLTSSPTPNQNYAPRNVLAVWVQTQGGTFVKTIDRWAAVRKGSLVAWNLAAGPNDADAVSGATRQSHATPVNITWDLKDKQGNVIPDGTYTLRMEVADSNANSAGQNNQGTFTFIKGAAPQNQTGLSGGGFSNVSIDFKP